MKMWGGQEEMINCKINIDKYYTYIVSYVLYKYSTYWAKEINYLCTCKV